MSVDVASETAVADHSAAEELQVQQAGYLIELSLKCLSINPAAPIQADDEVALPAQVLNLPL